MKITKLESQNKLRKWRQEKMEPALIFDIGNLCTHCGEDTSFGSGKFVDRIPSEGDGNLTIVNNNNVIAVTLSGYMCTDCRIDQCQQCGQDTLEPEIINNEVICEDCVDRIKELEK